MSVETSREAFLQALERLLSRPDAPEPGINAVAREARLNKVLIYRYFDSWNGLLETFARRMNPWRELRIETEAGLASGTWSNLADLLRWLLRAYLRRLAGSPLLQNLLRLSLIRRGPLQAALERDREQEGLTLLQLVTARFSVPEGTDAAAFSAVLIGGLTWLMVAGPQAGTFNGIAFSGPGADAVDRLEKTIDVLVETLTLPPPRSTL